MLLLETLQWLSHGQLYQRHRAASPDGLNHGLLQQQRACNLDVHIAARVQKYPPKVSAGYHRMSMIARRPSAAAHPSPRALQPVHPSNAPGYMPAQGHSQLQVRPSWLQARPLRRSAADDLQAAAIL